MPEHLVHGVLTVLTCGLWGVSWLSISVVMKGERWRCMRCRAPQSEDPARGPVEFFAEVTPEMGRVISPGSAPPPLSVIRTERLEKVA